MLKGEVGWRELRMRRSSLRRADKNVGKGRWLWAALRPICTHDARRGSELQPPHPGSVNDPKHLIHHTGTAVGLGTETELPAASR